MIFGFDAKRIFHNNTGLGNYGRDLIRILSSHYPNEKYVLYNPKKGKINPNFTSQGISISYPSKKWRFFSKFWRQSGISNQIKKENISLYHGLTGEIPTGLTIPSIVTIHDLIFMRFPKLYTKIDRWIYTRKAKYAVENADHIIAISEQTKKDIIDFFKISPTKITVIMQGCNPIFKKSFTKSFLKEVQKKYALPPQFILNVGTIEERKNALLILKAINNTNYHLVLVGRPTDYKKILLEYIATQNLTSQVHFLENLTPEELAGIYQLATVFCYPSIFEGFGIPIIEALFSKIPVIASKGSSLVEVGGDAIIYIDPKDSKTLKEKIILLYEETTYREKLIEKGNEHLTKFDEKTIAKKYFEVYKKVAKLED